MTKRVKRLFYEAFVCGFKDVMVDEKEDAVEYACEAVNSYNVDLNHLMFKTEDGLMHDFPMQDVDFKWVDVDEKRTVG